MHHVCLELCSSQMHRRIKTQIWVVVYIWCAAIVIVIHCRRGSVCLRVCLVILTCYISLSAVVCGKSRKVKQYLKQHYPNIKTDSDWCALENGLTADLKSVQPAFILSMSPTLQIKRLLEADYEWWATLLLASLSIVGGFLIFSSSCVSFA